MARLKGVPHFGHFIVSFLVIVLLFSVSLRIKRIFTLFEHKGSNIYKILHGSNWFNFYFT